MLIRFALALLLTGQMLVFAETTTYTIKRGDTLYSIAREFNTPLEQLLELNGITDPARIKAGSSIKLSPGFETGPEVTGASESEKPDSGRTHIVEPGDTLYSLSQKYALPLGDLIKANPLSHTRVLRIGQRLVIPIPESAGTDTSADAANAGNTAQTQSANGDPQPDSTTENGTAILKQGTPYWPHAGKIETLDGKLASAVVIIGEKGDDVVSVSAGRVTWAAPFRGYGKMVFVKSRNGYVFGYGGNGELFVRVGDGVTVGTRLGSLGVNSHDGVAKVFFFVTKNGEPLTPTEAPRPPLGDSSSTY